MFIITSLATALADGNKPVSFYYGHFFNYVYPYLMANQKLKKKTN